MIVMGIFEGGVGERGAVTHASTRQSRFEVEVGGGVVGGGGEVDVVLVVEVFVVDVRASIVWIR